MKKAMVAPVALIVVLGLLLGGCLPSGDYTSPSNTPSSDVPDTPVLPANNTPPDSAPVFDNPPPENVTWISPGKVNIANYYPGARAEYPVTIHNGNDVATGFSVSYRHPDNTATGYSKPPPGAESWVIIADATPVLMPRETREILIILAMPEDAAVFAESWEFWVSVTDASQTGEVKTAMAVRWLVDMRSS